MTGQSNIWFIIQTNPQCETKAVEEIRRAGFRAYLPKAARDVRHHRTKELILKRRPALVGYVFMRFPDGRPNWYALRQCQGVKAKFKPGMSVRASTGPWEHIIARIERVTKAGRIEAVTSLFGRETSVEYTELDKLDIVDEAA